MFPLPLAAGSQGLKGQWRLGYLLSHTPGPPYLLLYCSPRLSAWRTPLETGTSNATLGRSPHCLTVITVLSVDCPPAPRASHTFPSTLNVTRSAAQQVHSWGSLLPYLFVSLPAQITITITKGPLCSNPRLLHQKVSPEWWGLDLCIQPCPPRDWRRCRDGYGRCSRPHFSSAFCR